MRTRRRQIVGATAAAVTTVALMWAGGPAQAGGAPFTVPLTGAAEVPGPGDPDGSGVAEITINAGLEEVCWSITTENLAAFTGAHIHRGTADVAGPVVVPLSASAPGCTTAPRALLIEILRDPELFYVNVHTVEYRPGAVRGQLSR